MRENLTLQAVVGALVLVAAGAMVLAAEEIRLEVLKTDESEVVVDVNGASAVVQLNDLSDGEEREVTAGEHTVVVHRSGDELIVRLDGAEIGASGSLLEQGEDTHCVRLGDGDDEVVVKTVVVVRDDGAAEGKARIVHLDVGEEIEADLGARLSTLGVDLSKLQGLEGIDLDDHVAVRIIGGDIDRGPDVVKMGADRVRYRCAGDGTVLTLKKTDATQERYLCPVCGREMDEVEHATIRVEALVDTLERDEPAE